MKKIAFVIPYFGKFNNYFQLFLNSCKYNDDCDWIIFTDDKTQYQYPTNVHVYYTNFEEMKKVFQKKFDFDIYMDKPYKLCDYKVSYGYVFEEYLQDYKFWGYCDTDLIFGNIKRFITEEDLNKYDKIGIFGHCTIFKNTKEINTLFMKELNGKVRYKEVFQNNKNCSFDEEYKESINNIFEEYKKKIKYDLKLANIYTKSSNFKLTEIDLNTYQYKIEKKKKAFFLWNHGELNRLINENRKIISEEFLYIHMQSRKMKVMKNINKETYKIIPNYFENIETKEIDFNKIRIKHFNLHYFRLRGKNLFLKTIRRIKEF